MNPLDDIITLLSRKGTLLAPKLGRQDLAMISARVAECVRIVQSSDFSEEGKAAVVRELTRTKDKILRHGADVRISALPPSILRSFQSLQPKIDRAVRSRQPRKPRTDRRGDSASAPAADDIAQFVKFTAEVRAIIVQANFANVDKKELISVVSQLETAIAAHDEAEMRRTFERYRDRVEQRRSRLYDRDYRGEQALSSLTSAFQPVANRLPASTRRATGGPWG
ncbi:MAG: hypothetical protein AAF577_11785 [Pseudomonadota bacterium]